MSVVVVSLHERDAPLEVLERVAVADKDLPKTLALLGDSPNLSEAVVLSTCMRTEVYAVADRFHDGVADIVAFFEQLAGSSSTLSDQLVVAYDDAAARHLFGVAAGLDSAVLGEGEILRQVRDAAQRAREENAIGPVLTGMFRHATEVGKRARTETAIAQGITSLSHLAVALVADELGGDLAKQRAVVVGTGEMGSGIISALRAHSAAPNVVVASRSPARARTEIGDPAVEVIALDQLNDELGRADVIFSATTSDSLVLDLESVQQASALRDGRMLRIVDVSVPRDVDPAVKRLRGVELTDVDDLRRFAETKLDARRREISSVEVIIDEELDRYRVVSRGRTVAPLITALHSRAEELRVEELTRVSARLEALSPEERELVESLTKRLVAKLLHEPTVQLKNAAGSARGERLSEALRNLFGL
jgi:glutamyl-tRNA reductase